MPVHKKKVRAIVRPERLPDIHRRTLCLVEPRPQTKEFLPTSFKQVLNIELSKCNCYH
jgi:hypothetical protein